MAIVCRSLPSIMLTSLVLLAQVARGEPHSSSLRWISTAKPTEEAAAWDDDEPLPSPLVPPLDGLPDEVPPAVGGDLAQPPPVYYESTDVEPQFGEPYEYQSNPRHSIRSRLLPHRGLATYLHNRPHQAPLERDSWLNRPYAASFLVGGLFLADPLAQVQGDAGVMFGGRLSWDFEPHWGVESRLALAYPGLTDPTGVTDFRPAHAWMWDLNWLWYWTGDTRWRPYFSVGLGALDLRYDVAASTLQHNTTFAVPFGVGLKYRHSTRMAMRIDFTDNYSFAAGPQESMHNLSLTAGFETRFGGGMRRSYWPWNPGHDWR